MNTTRVNLTRYLLYFIQIDVYKRHTFLPLLLIFTRYLNTISRIKSVLLHTQRSISNSHIYNKRSLFPFFTCTNYKDSMHQNSQNSVRVALFLDFKFLRPVVGFPPSGERENLLSLLFKLLFVRFPPQQGFYVHHPARDLLWATNKGNKF